MKIKTEETAELLAHISVLMSAKISKEVEEGKLSKYSLSKLIPLGYANEEGQLTIKEGVPIFKFNYNKVVLGEMVNLLQ